MWWPGVKEKQQKKKMIAVYWAVRTSKLCKWWVQTCGSLRLQVWICVHMAWMVFFHSDELSISPRFLSHFSPLTHFPLNIFPSDLKRWAAEFVLFHQSYTKRLQTKFLHQNLYEASNNQHLTDFQPMNCRGEWLDLSGAVFIIQAEIWYFRCYFSPVLSPAVTHWKDTLKKVIASGKLM